ncbi:hypothetical protein niasHS_008751 [Heterodera schachtii]|uniref:J domain-containing protein n=1 Tax=Heterodera schachtii TaxID=97005 RepID=A0ABD2JA37_HETSC
MPLTFFNVWPTSNKNDTFNGANLLPHEWLCVRQNATAEEINQNYNKLALATHPDKNNKCSDKLFMLLPHEWLCVRQNATPEEINQNYRKLALATHPDKNNKCSDKLFTDNDQQMQLAFEPFTAVFNKPKYQTIIAQLNTMPKSAGDCATVRYDVFLVNTLIEDAKNFDWKQCLRPTKKHWSRSSSAKCAKQMHLDDIYYCHKATTKCHCNARNCCDTKLEECGSFL